jgi:hypothetical protein
MTPKCPCCNRRFRLTSKRPANETPGETQKRLVVAARKSINANLRKPMPAKTLYRR